MHTHSTKYRNYTSKADVRERLFAASGGRCAYCGDDLAASFHVDHIIPMKDGGTHDDDNLVVCCSTCNSVKGARDLDTFRRLLSARLHGIPRFTPEQLDWLSRVHGVSVEPPPLTFWYERE